MPKNKTQGIIFGIIMSYSMAIGMEIYNNAMQQGVHLQPGGFTNLTSDFSEIQNLITNRPLDEAWRAALDEAHVCYRWSVSQPNP